MLIVATLYFRQIIQSQRIVVDNEEALDLLIRMKKEQAQAMHESKEELLTSWETKD
jgi:hypothetical protein